MEDALPARKSRQHRRKLPVVSESIIRGLLYIRGGGAGNREVDDQGPGHNVGAGHKAPEAGVSAVVAVVAEHKILTLGNHQLPVASKALHLPPPHGIDRAS